MINHQGTEPRKGSLASLNSRLQRLVALDLTVQDFAAVVPRLLLRTQDVVQRIPRINALAAERDQLANEHQANLHGVTPRDETLYQSRAVAIERKIVAIMEPFPELKREIRLFINQLSSALDRWPVEPESLTTVKAAIAGLEIVQRGGPALPDLTWSADYRDLGNLLTLIEDASSSLRELIERQEHEVQLALQESADLDGLFSLLQSQRDSERPWVEEKDFAARSNMQPQQARRMLANLNRSGYVSLLVVGSDQYSAKCTGAGIKALLMDARPVSHDLVDFINEDTLKMPVFSMNHAVMLIRQPGTPIEKREEVVVGGDLKQSALFHLDVKPRTGDVIEYQYFDEPRVITSVTPEMALDGPTHFRASLVPRSQHERESNRFGSITQNFAGPVGNVAVAQGSAISITQTAAHTGELKRADELIDALVKLIKDSDELPDEVKSDCEIDAAQLKAELRRSKPVKERVWEIVQRLSTLGGAAKLIELTAPHLKELAGLIGSLI